MAYKGCCTAYTTLNPTQHINKFYSWWKNYDQKELKFRMNGIYSVKFLYQCNICHFKTISKDGSLMTLL